MIVQTDILYYIAHNGANTFHYGTAISGQEITTGQPIFETFNDIDSYYARLNELNIATEAELNMNTEETLNAE